jgi:hypothetical protein
LNGLKPALLKALAATDTIVLADGVRFFDFSVYTVGGAVFFAQGATNALLFPHPVPDQWRTMQGGAMFLDNVRFIFFTKIAQGRENRVGR